MRSRRVALAFEMPAAGEVAAAGDGFPGFELREPENSRRTVASGALAALLHFGVLGFLILLGSLAPLIDEKLIPVQLLHEEPLAPEEPAPAPKILAERRQGVQQRGRAQGKRR